MGLWSDSGEAEQFSTASNQKKKTKTKQACVGEIQAKVNKAFHPTYKACKSVCCVWESSFCQKSVICLFSQQCD